MPRLRLARAHRVLGRALERLVLVYGESSEVALIMSRDPCLNAMTKTSNKVQEGILSHNSVSLHLPEDRVDQWVGRLKGVNIHQGILLSSLVVNVDHLQVSFHHGGIHPSRVGSSSSGVLPQDTCPDLGIHHLIHM